MKKINFKKFATLTLSGAMTCSLLAGCGKSEEKTNSTTESTSTKVETTLASDSDASGEYDNSYCVNGEPSELLTNLRDGDTLRVGSSGDIFAYVDQETGEFTGIDAEIIKEAAKRLGIENVKMELIPFSELIINLNSDNIDIIADGMYVKAERAEQIYFGEIWYTQGGGFLVPEDSPISSLEDCDPKTTIVGYTPGTVWQTMVEKWAEGGLIKEALATGDQTESIVALQYGKISAYLTDSTVVEDLLISSPETLEGLKLAENYVDDPSAIGRIAPSVSFENIAFMNEINAALVQMREDGTLEKLFSDVKLEPKLHMITNDERTHDLNTK